MDNPETLATSGGANTQKKDTQNKQTNKQAKKKVFLLLYVFEGR